jgi:hypothetical protein
MNIKYDLNLPPNKIKTHQITYRGYALSSLLRSQPAGKPHHVSLPHAHTHTNSLPAHATLGSVYVHRNVTWKSITFAPRPVRDVTRASMPYLPRVLIGTLGSTVPALAVCDTIQRRCVTGQPVPNWNFRDFPTTVEIGTSEISTTAPSLR